MEEIIKYEVYLILGDIIELIQLGKLHKRMFTEGGKRTIY